MIRSKFILLMMLLFVVQTQAQEAEKQQQESKREEKTVVCTTPVLRLGIEVGTDISFDPINKPERIRENQSYYQDGDYDFHCGFVPEGQSISYFYFGVKPEFMFHKRFLAAAGVRFSTNSFTFNSDKDYFLWKLSENNINTHYTKINSISQKNYYFGVPLELRYFFIEKDFFVRHYILMGTTLNFLLTSNTEIAFTNPAMGKYTSQVMEYIEKPSFFQGFFYLGIGLKIGKLNNPCGRIEVHLPVASYGKTESKIINNFFGVGLQATLLIPIVKEFTLTYTVEN